MPVGTGRGSRPAPFTPAARYRQASGRPAHLPSAHGLSCFFGSPRLAHPSTRHPPPLKCPPGPISREKSLTPLKYLIYQISSWGAGQSQPFARPVRTGLSLSAMTGALLSNQPQPPFLHAAKAACRRRWGSMLPPPKSFHGHTHRTFQ